jgi:hypothetical protein
MLSRFVDSVVRSCLHYSNVFPHSTFNWVGIDGTQVLCHMTPVGVLWHLLLSYDTQLTVYALRYLYCTSYRRRRQQGHQEPQGTPTLDIYNTCSDSCAAESGVFRYRTPCLWQWRWWRRPVVEDVGKRKHTVCILPLL